MRLSSLDGPLLEQHLRLAARAQQDVFQVTTLEQSPREALFQRELLSWANATEHLRLVATLTTTPRRIDFIEPALDSLLKQTRPLDALYLFVPTEPWMRDYIKLYVS